MYIHTDATNKYDHSLIAFVAEAPSSGSGATSELSCLASPSTTCGASDVSSSSRSSDRLSRVIKQLHALKAVDQPNEETPKKVVPESTDEPKSTQKHLVRDPKKVQNEYVIPAHAPW